jgi:predicted RNA-binding Zn ribbon-like protein
MQFMINAALELINSEHHRYGQLDDRLGNEAWVNRFLVRWGLPRSVSRRHLTQLRELRDLLRMITEQLTSEQAVSDHALEELNAYFEPRSVCERVVRSAVSGFTRESVSVGPISPSSAVAREFLKLLVDGDQRRLKVCANDTCRWAFYDESRNRIRVWCDSTRCGNVMKVRRFRERKRR